MRAPALLLLLVACGAALRAEEVTYQIEVDSGAYDRHACAITVELPSGSEAGAWILRGEDGVALPVGVDDSAIAHAILPDLAKGTRQRFRLAKAPASATSPLSVRVAGDALTFAADGRELATYQGGPGELPVGYAEAFRRGGYLARLCTPAGALVTDDYPPNHRHHHGVWFSWTKTAFEGRSPDFWNMGDKTGTVEAVARSQPWQGALWAGFHATHRYRDLKPLPAVTVLDETWNVTVQAPQGPSPALVIDLVVGQRCATTDPLVLPTYHYGGLGVRGNRAWDGKDDFKVLSSEGKVRADADHTRGRWCHLGGLIDGHLAGIAVLCHPGNLRSPQPMRVHPSEPFFCYAPSQLGEWSITPGEPLVLRYRLVITDGAPDAADLDRRWRDWAEPPTVTVVR